MIDLHCHIIPWIDDGADSAAVACKMAEHALRSGVDTIVCTPHCNISDDIPNYRGRDYDVCFGMFRALLQQHGIPLRVLPGCELFASRSNLRRLLDENRIATLNHSRYLLTEFNFNDSGERMTAALDLIAQHGRIPVVAHPERYDCVQRDPKLAVSWFAKGYIIQLNKGSLLGLLGQRAYYAGTHLLASGIAHAVASDAHDDRYRTTGLQSLLPVLERYCSPDYVQLLLETNPKRIIQDRHIPAPESE
ncbi:MAG: hypothetical protein II875_15065 [Clostridia bacterium]|nr:hypothetical protein [Oscillospiraceae bacterium]MBQ3763305.1 hypothetical protein [Clostridia bacterium]